MTGTATIGGTITGLTTSGLVLQNNGSDDLTVSSGASTFTFATPIARGFAYNVTIKTQPTGLTCAVTKGVGDASSNVTSVVVSCSATCTPGTTIVRNWGTFTESCDGKITFVGKAGIFGNQNYTNQTLIWMKCSHGQVYNSTRNDCTGTGTTTAYGANSVQYCNVASQACNNVGTGLLDGTGTSSAYTACNELNANGGTFGKTNWRVPTLNELRLLIECTDTTVMPSNFFKCNGSANNVDNGYGAPNPSINSFFPNTQSNYYWSSSTYTTDTSKAYNIFFGGGVIDVADKTSNRSVRCVSGP